MNFSQNQEMQKLSEIYKESFFGKRNRMMWRVPIWCEAIKKVFMPFSVIDFGCAIGDFVKGFENIGIRSIGIEGSKNAIPYMVTKEYIIHDLRKPFVCGRYDLCQCLEVAEHIEPEYVNQFIENLCMASENILISAAPPGQKGHHHVNCQPIEYWDKQFKQINFERDDNTADKIKREIFLYKDKPGLKAYYQNLHFYRKEKP